MVAQHGDGSDREHVVLWRQWWVGSGLKKARVVDNGLVMLFLVNLPATLDAFQDEQAPGIRCWSYDSWKSGQLIRKNID